MARNGKRSGRRTVGPWRPMLAAWLILTAVLVLRWADLSRRGDAGDPSDPPRWLPGCGVEVPEYVEEDLIPVNEWSRPGRWLRQIDGVVIHYVGNPGSSARANRNYFASLADGRSGTYASSHFIVGLDGEVVQCVPLTEVSYASNHRNSDTIGIEVCHPDAAGRFSDRTYARLMDLTAWICETFGLDPETDVIRHYDVTGKICPKYYVEHPEAWDQLLRDLSAKLDQIRGHG